MTENRRLAFSNGMRDGIPIATGYFAVSFTLGIAAKNAGFTPLQAMIVSMTNNASAGEYAGFTLIFGAGINDTGCQCPLSFNVLCVIPEAGPKDIFITPFADWL